MFKVIVSHRSSAISSAIAAALLVSGCALSPNAPPPVDMPVATTPPVLQPLEQVAQTPSGSLFNASRYRPAFEDRRARMVGDLVTVRGTVRTDVTLGAGYAYAVLVEDAKLRK